MQFLHSQEGFENVKFQTLIIALATERLDFGGIDVADDLQKMPEHFEAVFEMARLQGRFRSAHGLDVETDAAVVAAPFEHPDSIESPAQVHGAESFVLIVFQ